MKNIPLTIKPSNISSFKQIREERELVRFKKLVLEFMLTDKFISGENRCFELADSNGQILYKKEHIELCQNELKSLGWEIKDWRSSFFIYPPNEPPKVLKYESLDV